MMNYILRRLLYLIGVILVVSVLTFMLMHSVPGGPFDREKTLPDQVIQNLNKRYHLDEPLWKQYTRYLYDVFVPRFSTAVPAGTDINDDYLITFQMGRAWIRWIFAPLPILRTSTVCR